MLKRKGESSFPGPCRIFVYGLETTATLDKDGKPTGDLAYLPGMVWWATLPWAEVEAAIGNAGLHLKRRFPLRMILGGLGMILMAAFYFVTAIQLTTLGGALIGTGIMALFGVVLGVAVGWLFEQALAIPIYTVRAYFDKELNIRVVFPFGYEDLGNTEVQTVEDLVLVRGVPQQQQGGEDGSPGSPPRPAPSLPKLPFPIAPAWSSKGLWHYWRCIDVKAFLTGGTSTWQKLQIGSLAIIAGALVFSSIFAFLVTQKSTAPGTNTTLGQQFTPEQLRAIAEAASNAKR